MCLVDGCSKSNFAAGFCSTHYNRRRMTGTTDNGPRARGRTLEQRLWSHIDVRGSDDCWLWTAGLGGHGYGLIALGGRGAGKEAAHRVVWRLKYGEIPKEGKGHHGGVIRHKCNNRRCCNPAHLELGSQKDNVADMWKPGKHKRGNAILTRAQVDQIRSDPRSSRQVAQSFGVSDAHVRHVRTGRCWAQTTPSEA